MRKPNVQLLCDSGNGVYIPKLMIQRLVDSGWRNIPENASTICTEIDNDQYWDKWQEVLDNAEWHDPVTSQVFKLHHDGDLFAYCMESLTPTEHYNLFGDFPEWYTSEREWFHEVE